MFSFKSILAAVLVLSFTLSVLATPGASTSSGVNTTICNGQKFVYQSMAGYGFLPSDARDKFGDTIGGIGSSIAMDKSSWQRNGNSYQGLLYVLPDRGWNTNGTLNYQNRLHKIKVTLTPDPSATVRKPSDPNLNLEYLDTILFTDPNGVPTSGLDAGFQPPYKTFSLFPFELPSVNYTDNGFGGSGRGGHRVVVDSEGLFLAPDGTFWVSDEYGPYVYHFNTAGTMIGAIRPPDAFIPLRNNTESFSADSPPLYDPVLFPTPEDNPTGRDNNDGFEGLTTNPEGTKLYALVQSALNQEGGLKDHESRYVRFLVYDITESQPVQEAEYVVPLNHVDPSDNSSDVAHQSEIHYVSDTQFMVLARDKDVGRGQEVTQSMYRQIDIFDISNATNVMGVSDCYSCQIADDKGNLFPNVTTAEYCQWLDLNENRQLRRFGVHNGGEQNRHLLNEKWESMALLPVFPEHADVDEYFLFSFSDNDFITQNGYLNFGKFQYQDASGYNLLNQALVFRVSLPKGSKPLVG